MKMSNRLTAVATSCAILAAVMLSATGAMAKTNRAHHRPQYREQMQRPAGCPVHQIADGSLVDCQGWRKWSGSIGWDNSCLNLDYLPSAFACSSRGGRN
jgi:hypothetical protein